MALVKNHIAVGVAGMTFRQLSGNALQSLSFLDSPAVVGKLASLTIERNAIEPSLGAAGFRLCRSLQQLSAECFLWADVAAGGY